MRNIYCIIICMLLLSCQKSVTEIIDGGDYKYWYHTEAGRNLPTFYYFDSIGACAVFFKCTDGTFKEYDCYDVPLDNEWHVVGDSILHINGYDDRIILANDTMLIHERNGSLDTLHAASPEMIPEKFRQKQAFKQVMHTDIVTNGENKTYKTFVLEH